VSRNNGNKKELIESLSHSLHKYGMRTVLFQQNMAHKIGVVQTDLKTAEILNETGPITAGDLSRITGLTSGSVTALVDRLENAGLVKREKHPEDRRKVMIVPISERQREIHSHYESLAVSTKAASEAYSIEELQMIFHFVDTITNIIDNENEKLMKERDRE
jgi:DNA-binding MarR family transcriptional regulator